MQTNGFATEDQIASAVEAGGKDISISLDSLQPVIQDKINGNFNESWHQALKAIALFTKYLPRENSFASLGCVLQPYNLSEIEDVIKFGTEISWFSSLVPVHVSENIHPRGFRSSDQLLRFKENEVQILDSVIERVRSMRKEGFMLYDSDQYLDDIKRFVRNEPTTWREKNNNLCDSPNLYFALLPNGEFAPCCDYRIETSYPAYHPKFPAHYKSRAMREEVLQKIKTCDGCMYGSYPEISISMRYFAAKLQRIKTFITSPPEKRWPISFEELLQTAERIRSEDRERPLSRKQKETIRILSGQKN